jgi:hypothetical protein
VAATANGWNVLRGHLNSAACGWFPIKSETRNPKSETNPKSEGQMSKTAPGGAVWGFFRFPPFEFV